MFRLVSGGIPLLLSALLLGGCARQRCACTDGAAGAWPVAPLPTETRTERGSLSPDLSAVLSYEAVDRALGEPAATDHYRVLRAEEVQCMAAANAPLGNLYAAESEAVESSAARRSRSAAHTMSQLMAYRAIDERNKAAATALELFYSLAEAEANRDILKRSVETVDRAVANLDQLRRSGLKIPFDQTALQRQKLDWLDRQIQLQSAVRRMQGQLQQICGLEADPSAAVWPEADLTVTVTPTDVQAAITEGLANRADVGALRMLDGSLSADTLPAARSGIQSMSPGLGASVVARRLFGGEADAAAELPMRQSQVSQARTEAERTAVREIREAAENVDTRLREIAVAGQRHEVWSERVAGLKEKHEADGVTAFDIDAGELELLRAEGDAIHRVIAWRLAQAKLKHAQGLLAAECGYNLPDCCQ